jgi:hypothetical protein
MTYLEGNYIFSKSLLVYYVYISKKIQNFLTLLDGVAFYYAVQANRKSFVVCGIQEVDWVSD